MATPIAHKGATAGAKVVAMTVMDFLTQPDLMASAKDYFENEQKKETEYKPMITEQDPPPIELNTAIMEQFRPELEKFYFDETKYDTYLEQLGVEYPTVKED
jgi:aminobenzoyl-glutamate utilization protein B